MSKHETIETGESLQVPDRTSSPTEPAIPFDIFCQQCGYNLRGLTGGRCPECGYSLESVRSKVSGIPWVYRKEMGRFRAFWRTVGFTMFRQRRFCDEMARPVSYADSQRFRWMIVLHVYAPVLLMTVGIGLWAAVFGGRSAASWVWREPLIVEAFEAVWPVVVSHVCLLAFLAAATGIPSYFFHPKTLPLDQQNRAVALSYYGCGPLAIAGLAVLAACVGWALSADSMWGLGLLLLAGILPFAQLAAWWIDLIHLSRRIMPQCARRTLLVGLSVPVLWSAAFVLIFFALPLIAFGVVLAVHSLAG